ncbi:1-phosphofructokinase [Cuneatibacter caecimuris]|uniref:Tagatose-6-phosphate kinase n=1 Tax=Cuneatibacter caecimuris TaxID=1796618 RepID=A0A4Q7PLB6_9FIRM|nr:1-phosphofructokinase [Cuneatibacter caecimuris]RZT01137.1 tagatose 6-phosphate kinase [Cuneatibacter caecimuris]
MILTVTLNVAVDKAYVIEGPLQAGEVMRVKTCSNTAGGKGLNVSKVIGLCGEEVLATGFTGGFNGAYVEKLLTEKGIPNEFVHVKGETRSCINILDGDGKSTEFLEPGAPVTAEEEAAFLRKFETLLPKCSVVTMSGSAPKGLPADIYGKLIAMGKKAGVKMILDTSGQYLIEGVKAKPFLIKPNHDEIAQLLGRPAETMEEMLESAKELHRSGIPYVVISLGADGAAVVCGEGVYTARPPKIQAVNTVGCGDSMVGAMAAALERGYGVEEMLRYAVAVSSANAMNLETGYFRQEDMEENLKQVIVEKIG